MKKILLALLFVLLSTQVTFASSTITSSQLQIISDGMLNPSLLITGATPWDFTGQDYLGLSRIDQISVTLTLFDGNTGTGFGDFDTGQLVLQLDGLNTGLLLDGFASDLAITRTLTGPNQAPGLLAALQTDGYLLGSIYDLSPDDNYIKVMPNFLATLSLTEVPIPGAIWLLGSGMAGLLAIRRKKKA